jgi:hypothetical protein
MNPVTVELLNKPARTGDARPRHPADRGRSAAERAARLIKQAGAWIGCGIEFGPSISPSVIGVAASNTERKRGCFSNEGI